MGQTHYGWVRLTVTVKHKGTGHGPTGSFSATITEYGYESVANKSCDAGLPGAATSNVDHASAMTEQESDPKSGPGLGCSPWVRRRCHSGGAMRQFRYSNGASYIAY